MQWRALVMLLMGMAVIYFVSLLQDKPYPHPAKLFIDKPTKLALSTKPNANILKTTKTHVYYTSIWYKLSTDEQNKILSFKESSSKTATTVTSYRSVGYLRQYRRPIDQFLTNSTLLETETPNTMEYSFATNKKKWELVHECLFNGPITSYSSPTNSDTEQTGLQFGILYNVLRNENIQHWIRIYYTTNELRSDGSAGLDYKDVLLPGSTWVSAFTLEANAILYSREPDLYQFRWLTLPNDFKESPHSEKADPVILYESQPGVLGLVKQAAVLEEDSIYNKKFALEAESHRGVLSKMYSVINGPYYTMVFNVYKTSTNFYEERYVADNVTIGKNLNKWLINGIKVFSDNIFYEEALEYMAFGDGAHIQHERVEMEMPELYLTRSNDAKVIVVSSIRNQFRTLTINDQNENKPAGVYYWELSGLNIEEYNIKINGVQLDDSGQRLAVWTDANQVYIYYRHYYKDLEEDSEEILGTWVISYVITPSQGELLGSSVDVVSFLTIKDTNYILVGMKNGVVNSYNLDKKEVQKPVNFWSFLYDQWHVWLPMSIVTLIFVIKENNYATQLPNTY
ncbi:hypothetical protein BJ944DRAFT_261337 [Cunninghamella echinulata]|nr:hypothetical protein BJ944DRAFT_261337 [Cunninghamella echinulata]